MTVLVTGAAGFIGFSVCRQLMGRGEAVVGLDNLNDYYDVRLKKERVALLRREHGDAFTFLQCDFADATTLNAMLDGHDIERVVHLGAQAGVRYARTHPHAYVQSNLVGHANILEYCRHRSGMKHLVYASSSSVYGSNTLPRTGFGLDQPVDHPRSLYAATKRANELMSESYSHLYKLPQTGLRFFTVYGPWGRPDMAMWLFTDAILRGKPITIFNNGEMSRDFTFIDDIVGGVIGCLDAPPYESDAARTGASNTPHRIYNIGNHRSEPLLKMIGLLEQALGREAIKQFEPMQADDVRDTYADISAVQRDIGFAPTTPIEVGIPAFVRWYLEYTGTR